MGKLTRRELSEGAAFCLELGTGLLENGAETSRVEETLRWVGESLDTEVESIVTPTGISLTFGHSEVISRIVRVKDRSVNLDKVSRLNELSRQLQAERLTTPELRARISQIRKAEPLYSSGQQLLATAVAAASLTMVVGGGFSEAGVATVAALLGILCLNRGGSEFPSFLSRLLFRFLDHGVCHRGNAGLGPSVLRLSL